jgi:transglutaminase-like putative cysteine protease
MPDQRAERWVQFTVGLMVCLGAAMLDVSREYLVFTLIMIPLVIISHWLTDRWGVLELPRLVVALTSLGAIALFYWEFKVDTSAHQLNLIGNLLMAWSGLTLLQRKAERVYGALAVFSLLAVVVSAVLSIGFVYIILLVIYSVTAAMAMMALYVFREESRAKVLATRGEQDISRTRGASMRVLLQENSIVSYQLPARESLSEVCLGWTGARQTLGIMLIAFLFAIVYFYMIPRTNRTRWNQTRGVGASETVGFSEHITFAEMGRILESDRLAMRIAFFDDESNQPYEIFGDVYVYGKPLIHYGDMDGEPTWSGYSYRAPFDYRLQRSRQSDLVRQEISLEPTRNRTRFAVYPFGAPQRSRDLSHIAWSSRQMKLFSYEKYDREEGYFPDRYTVTTPAFRNGFQSPIVSALAEAHHRGGATGDLPFRHIQDLLKIDRSRFPGLIKIADEIASEGEALASRIQIARSLLEHFATDEFEYTLDFSEVSRDETLDPVEDFAVNHRSGHCEYFASALAMMLRSQDIPARVIVGYRGGEFNAVGKYYQFYERDAHAWVEIYIPHGDVEESIYTMGYAETTGGWYRLDPTPTSSKDDGVRRNSVDQWIDYAQFVWSDYVVDMDVEKQHAKIYDPFASSKSAKFGQEWLEARNRSLRDVTSSVTSQVLESTKSLSLVGRLAVFGSLALALGVVVSLPVMIYRWWKRRRGSSAGTHRLSTIDFYLRLEKILQQLGVKRAEFETALELATKARQALLAMPDGFGAEVANVPAKIVHCFYDVRFGGRELELLRLQEIEGELASLELVVMGALPQQRRVKVT